MRAVALAIAASAVMSTALAQRSSFEGYAGRYPTELVDGRSFLEAMATAIQPLVGDTRWRRLLEYGTSTPIQQAHDSEFGEVLIDWQCHRLECRNEATILVTMRGQLIGVCLSDGRRAEWVVPGWRAPARETQCGSEPAELFARLRAARARQ
jgi:hypothetical protein